MIFPLSRIIGTLFTSEGGLFCPTLPIDDGCQVLVPTDVSVSNHLPAKDMNFGGAFHTPYMESASAKLSAALDAAEITMPSINVYSNVTGKPYTSVEEIKALKRPLCALRLALVAGSLEADPHRRQALLY